MDERYVGENPDGPPNPTEQLEDETDAAYAAFRVWLELEDDLRTLPRAAAMRYRGDATAVPKPSQLTRLKVWSTRHDWNARLRTHRAELDRVRRDAEREEAALMGSRQARAAVDLQNALLLPVREIVRRLSLEDSDMLEAIEAMAPAELLNLARLASRPLATAVGVERIARGEPNTISRRSMDVQIESGVEETEGRGGMSRRMLQDPDAAGAITVLTGRGGMKERRAVRRARIAEAGTEGDPNVPDASGE